MTAKLTGHQKDEILEQCACIAGSREIVAVCIYGPWVSGYADKNIDINVLMILDSFNIRLNTYNETVDDIKISILTVNRLEFERDVKKGWMGEFFAEKLTIPYEPLKNGEYLQQNEVRIKKRHILELLDNLIIEFPESSNEMLIEKEYFMYETMMRQAKLFPPLTYSYLNMFRGTFAKENKETIMDGYLKALNQLEQENVISPSDGYIKIGKTHIESVKKTKIKLSPIIKTIQRMALPPVLSVISESASSFIQDQQIFNKTDKKAKANGLLSNLEDPKKHILLPTPLGSISLADTSGITDVAKKMIPDGELSKMNAKKIGGVFNDVYSLTLNKNGVEQKFVIKQFLDWSNLKWIPLSLWAFGTTTFSVLGQSRLEKEYAINKFLHSKGFPVPKIFYISHKNRMIIEEYIEGTELVDYIKQIIASSNSNQYLPLLIEVGRKIAFAHSLGVSLGDCKPENFRVTTNDIVFLDLEQAGRDGNKVWDIAEFLYFSGHYNPPMSSTNGAIAIAKNVIDGYLEAGGKKETVKTAGSTKYTKVFSIFTAPHVLLAIANMCQNLGKE
jgi:tRNA A-37 threonylcarbamoyl transferase component Bud32